MSIAKGFIFNLVLGAYWRKNREISFIIDLEGSVKLRRKIDVKWVTEHIYNKYDEQKWILCYGRRLTRLQRLDLTK